MFKKYTVIVLFCLGVFLPGCGDWLCDCQEAGDPLPPVKISEIDGKEMSLVPAGDFIMGTNKVDEENTQQNIGAVKPLYLDQHPERTVHLEAYYMDRFEVTNREFIKFVRATSFTSLPTHWEKGEIPEGLEDRPVTNVTWWEAWSYCMWTHKTLPTEAQWEKAARGTDGRSYPWGNEYKKGMANIGIEGDRKEVPGGKYAGDLSPYKIHDMAGNVMEWSLDWYQAYPGNSHKDKRFGERFKVLRGTAFQKAGHYFLDAYKYAFMRTEVDPDDFFENVGFRCATNIIKNKTD